jgi:endonuclease/exonuclease/phosphatase family metal-dependent hydrolase
VKQKILTVVTALVALTLASCRRESSTAKSVDAAHGGGRPELRVMSFNLRHETDADEGPRAWRKRIVRIVGMIRDEAPDVIGVQEALQGQAADLRASMPTYAFFGSGRDDGGHAGEFAAIFYLVDRFERDAHDAGTFWLSDTPHVPGSRSWGNSIPRMATWIRLIDRRTERGFYVFNTHWDHQHQASRERSALLLADRIAQRRHANDPVLLLGDLNAVASNPAVGYLLGKRVILADSESQSPIPLIDTFDAVHARVRDRRTLHFWRGTRDGSLKIDYILASVGTEVLAAAIRDQDRPPLSDHFPVTARLILPQPSP